jgi:hypothetical protein
MSKSIRIRTKPNGDDSYLKVKVEQDFDFIEILSLKISQEEAYSRFCSDYGVVVGRVTINDGFGIPNAKVSIFIPISDEDSENSEISGLYPFKSIDDKDSENIRYNLLPTDNNTDNNCFTPVGTFPSKREVIDNDTTLEVYCKYYKFTTTTNNAGDFMLFGVPTGNHTLNVDVDLSDIGIASQRPYDYISQGENEKRFETPNKFKSDKDLDKLMQIKSFKKGINVQPFWGDKDQCDIGISRVDVDLKKRIIPSAIFIGSLFSDSEKNSINKNCRPRKDFGRLCETETGEGTIEMIRKTIDGKIERYDVEGGRVIGDGGSWAYQVPMNLDYKITDEFGKLVPSDDPNKGVPTRARVRFRIGKDVSGSEGRLRTTAKYLVPHNPSNTSDVDYNFNENTSDNHFRDFHWNKIYTVSNYIPRIQPTCIDDSCADTRRITGIKDVDDCVGNKVPFPYNRVDTDFNPLFLIICTILSIIVFIVWMINSLVLSILNIVLFIINIVLKAICTVIWFVVGNLCGFISAVTFGLFDEDACRDGSCIGNYSNGDCDCNDIISYIPCIILECEEKNWGPGCDCSSATGSLNFSLGCYASQNNSTSPKTIHHWSGLLFFSNSCTQTNGHPEHNVISAGVTDCYSIKLAEALDMFELDFYNDWVNGTLYTYLLKYKKNKSGKQKFCDIDCDSPDSDNGCDTSYLVDTLISNSNGILAVKKTAKKGINEGFIKQVTTTLPNGFKEEVLYYSPYSNHSDIKFFATELVHLGSIFECDWEGIPKLQPLLTPTTYKRPPYISEYKDDNSTKITCGMTSTGGNGGDGLFFDIDCRGLTVGHGPFGIIRNNNFKRICEFGVDIDQAELDSNNNITTPCDCKIDSKDINQPYGNIFRDFFIQLNYNDGSNKLNSWVDNSSPITSYNTTFDTVIGSTPFDNNIPFANNYTIFRGDSSGYLSSNSNSYKQTKNSLYFYFGTEQGITALDLMNRRFFNECPLIEKNDFIINGLITHITGTTCVGSIYTTVVGGEGPYTYVWTGPNGFALTEYIGDITNLCAGNYTVTVTDSNGGTSTNSFTVNQPATFSCSISSTNAIQNGGTGDLFINVSGGLPPYSYSINGNTPISMGQDSFINLQKPVGTYIVTVTDSNGLSCTNPLSGVTISQPPLLSLGNSVVWTDTSCGDNNGTITINNPVQSNIGGIPPYFFTISGPSGTFSQTSKSGLTQGTYTVTVTDGSPTAQISTQTVTINPSVKPILTIDTDWYCWPDPQSQASSPLSLTINPTINAVFNGGTYTVIATPRDSVTNAPQPSHPPQTFTTSPATFTGLLDRQYDFEIIDGLGCTADTFTDLRPNFGQVPSAPLTLNWVNSNAKFCWISPSPIPLINLQFVVSGVDGPFTITSPHLNSPYNSGPVPNGTIITLPTLTSPVIGTPMPFVITENTHGCSKTTNITLISGTHVPTESLNVNVGLPSHNCPSGSFLITANASATGGWGTYKYSWYPSQIVTNANCGQQLTCTVTDIEGCYKVSTPITI